MTFNCRAFLSEIEGRPGWWTLEHELEFTIEGDGYLLMIIVPKGYETNLASTPRWLWPVLPPFGTYTRATILHDYLCDYADRFFADVVFRLAMKEDHTHWFVRLIMFYAVRIFGAIKCTIVKRKTSMTSTEKPTS